MMAAAKRYQADYDLSLRRAAAGQTFTHAELVEMHAAALGLIWATNTKTIEEALDVLQDDET
jgi:hypothetical protein